MLFPENTVVVRKTHMKTLHAIRIRREKYNGIEMKVNIIHC